MNTEKLGEDPLVLVVEDDEAVRDLIEIVLVSDGFKVRTARDGLEGLVKLQVLRPAALVLDIMMPDVGGLRVLDELSTEHASVPVIVVTGNPQAAAEARGRIHPDNVFEKPFDVRMLVARVRDVVSPSPA